MLTIYNDSIKPVYCAEADLRRLVLKFELKLHSAKQTIKETTMLEQMILNSRNDNRLKQMKIDQKVDKHEETIVRSKKLNNQV